MSAFVVPARHIDYLLTKGLGPHVTRYGPIKWHVTDGEWKMLTRETATEVGRMLLAENQRSVNARYQREDAPPSYTFRPYRDTTAVQCLKAIACYEYQACETDAGSRAKPTHSVRRCAMRPSTHSRDTARRSGASASD